MQPDKRRLALMRITPSFCMAGVACSIKMSSASGERVQRTSCSRLLIRNSSFVAIIFVTNGLRLSEHARQKIGVAIDCRKSARTSFVACLTFLGSPLIICSARSAMKSLICFWPAASIAFVLETYSLFGGGVLPCVFAAGFAFDGLAGPCASA